MLEEKDKLKYIQNEKMANNLRYLMDCLFKENTLNVNEVDKYIKIGNVSEENGKICFAFDFLDLAWGVSMKTVSDETVVKLIGINNNMNNTYEVVSFPSSEKLESFEQLQNINTASLIKKILKRIIEEKKRSDIEEEASLYLTKSIFKNYNRVDLDSYNSKTENFIYDLEHLDKSEKYITLLLPMILTKQTTDLNVKYNISIDFDTDLKEMVFDNKEAAIIKYSQWLRKMADVLEDELGKNSFDSIKI